MRTEQEIREEITKSQIEFSTLRAELTLVKASQPLDFERTLDLHSAMVQAHARQVALLWCLSADCVDVSLNPK